MKLARLAATAICAIAFSFPISASAQSGAPGIASQLFDDGRDLMKKGDFQAACPKLAESARLEPRVGTLGRLAECEEKIGHLAGARSHWKDAVELARAQKDDRLAHAEDEMKRIDALVPRLMLSMKATAPPGFTLQLDQVSIGTETLGTALPVDPGRHTLAASATNRTPWSTAIDTKADGSTVPVEIPELAPVTTIAKPPEKQPDQAPPPPVAPPSTQMTITHPLRPVGIITAGIGGAALVLGSIAGLVANSQANKSYEEGCQNSGACPAGKAASDHDNARATATVSTIAFVAGGVLVAAGVTIFLVAPKKGSASFDGLDAHTYGSGRHMVGRHARGVGGCVLVAVAFSLLDCAGILGINPTTIENDEGGAGNDSGGPGFKPHPIPADAGTVTFSTDCGTSLIPIFQDGRVGIDAIVADETGVFFATIQDASSGLTLGLGADGLITVMDQHTSSRGLALDAHTLYFSFWDNRPSSSDSPTLAAWSRDTHATVTADLTPTNNAIGNIVLGGNHLYFGGWTLPNSSMWSVPLPFAASAQPQQVSTGATSPYRVAVDAQYIYYDEGTLDGDNGPNQTRVSKVGLGGGAPTLIDGDTNVDDMIVADGSLFWADRIDSVVRSSDGSAARDYAQIPLPIALAADPAHHQLYVLSSDTSTGTSSIMRIPSNQPQATPQTCVTGLGTSYAIYFYGGELYFGSWADAQSPSFLFDLTTKP